MNCVKFEVIFLLEDIPSVIAGTPKFVDDQTCSAGKKFGHVQTLRVEVSKAGNELAGQR